MVVQTHVDLAPTLQVTCIRVCVRVCVCVCVCVLRLGVDTADARAAGAVHRSSNAHPRAPRPSCRTRLSVSVCDREIEREREREYVYTYMYTLYGARSPRSGTLRHHRHLAFVQIHIYIIWCTQSQEWDTTGTRCPRTWVPPPYGTSCRRASPLLRRWVGGCESGYGWVGHMCIHMDQRICIEFIHIFIHIYLCT